jgi:hypothetical protein
MSDQTCHEPSFTRSRRGYFALTSFVRVESFLSGDSRLLPDYPQFNLQYDGAKLN